MRTLAAMLPGAVTGLSNELRVDRYRDQIGRMRHEVETPALLLDLDLARDNIARMAAAIAELGTRLRPHVKAHKSPELARLQMAAGAVGVACATVWEAVVMARTAAISDILIANEVVGDAKLRALAELGRDHRITVAVDDPLERPRAIACRRRGWLVAGAADRG